METNIKGKCIYPQICHVWRQGWDWITQYGVRGTIYGIEVLRNLVVNFYNLKNPHDAFAKTLGIACASWLADCYMLKAYMSCPGQQVLSDVSLRNKNVLYGDEWQNMGTYSYVNIIIKIWN